MAITDRTRKILWGRSGNLCALCRRVLVEEATPHDDESVVGDECHIVGEKPTAARGEFGIGRDDLDDHDNLILLCKTHHKLVDDQPLTYTVEKLREMKATHESWVRATLERPKPKGTQPKFAIMPRLRTGKALANVVGGACASVFDHDEPETEAESKLIAGFFQELQDCGDLWQDMEAGHRVEATFAMTNAIKELEDAGFLVFAVSDPRRVRLGDEIVDWPVAIVAVMRPTNKGITELGDLASLIVN